jgi:hypothetical protein
MEPYKLPLLPAAPPQSQAFHNASLSSWGGNAVKDSAGVYHLFSAAMTLGCNLGAWTSNSEVIHATSSSPLGPFQFSDVALPPWHHNPQALLHPDGTWLIYTIGTAGVPKQHNCRKEMPAQQLRGPKTGEFVQLHYAKDPSGRGRSST